MKTGTKRRIVGLLALLTALTLVNFSVFQKEQQLAHGTVMYLELAPVDPRSLMQGDYMALRFAIGERIDVALAQSELSEPVNPFRLSKNYVVVVRDGQKKAHFVALFDGQELAADELLLRYRVRRSEVQFATNAFFFQEGTAAYYEVAKYGQFRVNDQGEPLLVALYDEDLKRLGPSEKTEL